jgi:hypothetical protein
MRLTKAEAAALGRRQEQPRRGPGELLAIWCAGKLKNPLNGPQWGKQGLVKARYRLAWQERIALALLEHGGIRSIDPRQPKHVIFVASVFHRFDTDGLQAALKPIRDALVRCSVLSGDAERDGHTFQYAQVVDRKRLGIEIRVSLRASERSARGDGGATKERAR